MPTSPDDVSRLLLPVEIIEKIVTETWLSPMSNGERTSLFVSLCLVNHTWLETFVRIFLKDVHILSPSFAERYIALFREKSRDETDEAYLLSGISATANRACRTITFRIEQDLANPSFTAPTRNSRLANNGHAPADTISDLLHTISSLNYLPNLRHVTVEYVNGSFDDLFDHARLLSFPSQVTHLSLNYLHPKQKPSDRLSFPLWKMPNVRTLCLSGMPTAYVTALIATCPNINHLELADIPTSPDLKPLPMGIFSFRLMDPRVLPKKDGEKSRSESVQWGIQVALEAGLFSKTNTSEMKPRLVLRSRLQKASDCKEIKKLCDRYGVEFVSCSSSS
ncbi:hypothetical protein K474DRAFT_1666819 [Panus rudis PR-1116 ss-1]|nr:hypothetical protein K474DRAFT_1666819 [Panus rudis PR-1116 ss-1]